MFYSYYYNIFYPLHFIATRALPLQHHFVYLSSDIDAISSSEIQEKSFFSSTFKRKKNTATFEIHI